MICDAILAEDGLKQLANVFWGGGDFPEPRQICIQVGTSPYLRELAPLSPRFTKKKCWIRGGHDVYDDNDISSLENWKKIKNSSILLIS